MASPTWCIWVWVNSRSWWWTGRSGMLQFMGSQRVGHDWATELNWIISPGGAVVKNPPANAGDVSLIPGSGRSPGVGKYQPIPVFLPGKFHGESNLAGYSPWDCKESDSTVWVCTHTHTHNNYRCWTSYRVCWLSTCLLKWNVHLILPLIFYCFFFILTYTSCLYILEINPLSVASFANIFSHSEGFLLILFIVPFAVQKLLSKFHLFFFFNFHY